MARNELSGYEDSNLLKW